MADFLLQTRSTYHDRPPALQTRLDMNPTLLVSWWCTIFALTTILIRVAGRWVRTERLFREDKIMLYSIIPLMIRMGLVHVILLWGTNNTITTGLTSIEIMHRETGSKLVLASRIFYATFIWIAKLTVLEFLKRTVGPSWVTSYEGGLRSIYSFLALTYVGVIVATLTECRPFNHYWQVIPDPGPKCREGLVQLITMGVCDMVSDVVLIVFPIPLVMRSSMPFRRRFSLVLLFLLSIILIAITAYRIPSTISRKSAQQYRSLLASLEILAATGVSNAVVIGSFIRDKGVKKAKFRVDSADESNVLSRAPTRSKSITQHHWGSDEDLVRDMGVALPPSLQHKNSNTETMPRMAPSAPPGPDFTIHQRHTRSRRDSEDSSSSISTTDIKLRDLESQHPSHSKEEENEEHQPKENLTFFDVGGLVESNQNQTQDQSQSTSLNHPVEVGHNNSNKPTSSKAFLSDIGGLLHPNPNTEKSRARTRKLTPSPSNRDNQHRHKSRSTSTKGERMRRRFSRSPGPNRLRESSNDSSRQKNNNDPFNFSDAGGLLS